MKFYGIDCQGYLKLQEYNGSLPTFVTGQDERRLIYLDTGVEDRIYIGGDFANAWSRVVMDDGAGYPSLITELDTVYHPVGGDVGEPFISSTLTGSNTHGGSGVETVRITDDWVKLGDGSAITGSEQAGLRIEYGSPASDLDDITFFYDHDAPDVNGITSKWMFNNGGYSNEPIATHAFVNNAVGTGSALSWTKQETDNRYVRFADLGESGTYGNDTFEEWALLTEEVIGDAITQREIYRKNEIYSSYVRVGPSITTVTENSPLTSGVGAWLETDNVATPSTVVYRNSSANIYANLFIGTATKALYADLAEKYTCDETLPVGTVVEVTEDTEYEVEPCMFELSQSVVGVVSESPAYLMNSEGEGLPIALTGKVPVRVVGEVRKGDYIVPAGDGLARKGELGEAVAKIGIALKTDLHANEKLVECIIK